MKMRGRFITFEGGEGSGKSTQIALLADRLHACGIAVQHTREPGGTPLAEQIRALVRHPAGTDPVPMTELFLMLAARAQHVETLIRPALDQGQWVLCDRFSDSTLAYQGYGRGLALETIRTLNALAVGDTQPEHTILLTLAPQQGLERVRQRDRHHDRFTVAGSTFHERIHRGFLTLAQAEPARFHVIDAQQPTGVIAGHIWQRLQQDGFVPEQVPAGVGGLYCGV
jgi:dTMP kinase